MNKLSVIALTIALVVSLVSAQNPVTFQVNMNVQEFLGNFNPGAGDIVVVRGSFNNWSGNQDECMLTDTIYTCTVDIAETGDIDYKFAIVPGGSGNDIWESVEDRTYTVPAGGGTIDAVYFNNQGWDFTDAEVLFLVDMSVQILNSIFNPETDWVVVFGDHENLGSWGGTGSGEMERDPGTDIYSIWVQFEHLSVGQTIEYKYVILVEANPDSVIGEQIDNRLFSPTGEEPDDFPPPNGNGYGEIMPEVVYFDNVPPVNIITRDVLVRFHVDVRPAFYKIADPDSFIIDEQTGDTIWSVDEVDVAGFFNSWPWGGFDPDHIANDEGEYPDLLAGDTVYACDIQFLAGDSKLLAYKYGINAHDVEAGFAENHEVEIDDSGPIFTIWPPDDFGSQGTLYDPYIGVMEEPVSYVPEKFHVAGNYPNPFNPSTMIRFEIPVVSEVSVQVFNITGEEVFNHSTARLNPGVYQIPFDGSNLASGVYIYQLRAGTFTSAQKMVLMK